MKTAKRAGIMRHHWLLGQLDQLAEEQPDLLDQVFSQLLHENAELCRRAVIGAYLDEAISLAKAAELLDLTRDALQEQLRAAGIPIRQLTPEDSKAEVEAARRLRKA